MSYSLAPNIKSRFFITGTNRPLAGGLLYTYSAGTTTNAATYSDVIGTPNTNPVVLDSDGQCDLFLLDTITYRFILKNSAGVTQFDEDNIASVGRAASSATTDIQILEWAYSESFAFTTVTRNSNNVITAAAITWPDSGYGTLTTDTINATFNAVDAWHATHTLSGVTKTVTQTAVTRNANGKITAQPAITIS